jgi:hypothetical protein
MTMMHLLISMGAVISASLGFGDPTQPTLLFLKLAKIALQPTRGTMGKRQWRSTDPI